MTPDVPPESDNSDEDVVLTEQDYADARARHAGRPTFIPEKFARAVSGNGVLGDVLIGTDDDLADADGVE